MTKQNAPVCISVINMKGGVGKTTVAALLGRYASLNLKRRVVAIDLDPQANLSQAFMRDNYRVFLNQHQPSIVELFQGYVPPHNAAASPTLGQIDKFLVKDTSLGGRNLELIPSRFDFSDNLISSVKPNPRALAQVIANEFQDRDIVIIDCAPTESIFTRAAYHASRYVLVPVKPEYFSTIGFPLLNTSLGKFKKDHPNHLIDVAGIVINNSTYTDSGTGGPECKRSIAELRKQSKINNWHIFDNQIPFSRGFPKMMRGDFTHLGNAPRFEHFAKAFFEVIGA